MPGQQQAFDDHLFAVDQLDRRISALEGEITRIASDTPQTELLGRLRCLRGIDTLPAVGLVCEVGNLTRFKTADQFMSFVCLVPSECSSGEGIDHQGRLGARSPAAGRSGLEILSAPITAARIPPCSAVQAVLSGCSVTCSARSRIFCWGFPRPGELSGAGDDEA